MLVFNTFLFGILLVVVSFALACFIAPWFDEGLFSKESKEASHELGWFLMMTGWGGFMIGLVIMLFSH